MLPTLRPPVAREDPVLREYYFYTCALISTSSQRSAVAQHCLGSLLLTGFVHGLDIPKMQPSIVQETENICSMCRISSQSGPVSLALDPDLPLAPSPPYLFPNN